jgi:homogentisate solanesyltransferase
VKCPTGCGKKVKRKEIEEHKKRCPREEVVCKLKGPNARNRVSTCGKKMLQSQLESHQRFCKYRTFECKFCRKASTYCAITGETQTDTKQAQIPPAKGHYAECPEYPLFCKNKCHSKAIKRAEMEQHLEECPLELVQCPHWDEGCKEMVRRKDMKKHMKSYETQHQNFVWSAYNRQKKRFGGDQGRMYHYQK